jgi:hypothetical protein
VESIDAMLRELHDLRAPACGRDPRASGHWERTGRRTTRSAPGGRGRSRPIAR